MEKILEKTVWKSPLALLELISKHFVLISIAFVINGLILLCVCYEIQIHISVKITLGVLIGLYLIVPIIFYCSATLQQHIIFQHYVRRPKGVDFSKPETKGQIGTRNLYLEPQKGLCLGIWHALPMSLISLSQSDNSSWNDLLKSSDNPIILYLHGATGCRSLEHRRELYSLLQRIDCHVITLDYRGFGDSTNIPLSEQGTVDDGLFVYKWIKNILNENTSKRQIFIWGHSLGSGIACHLTAKLCIQGDYPTGLILESPFTNISDVVYKYTPLFEKVFIRPLIRNDIAFQNDNHISQITIPITIFHAEDDHVIPFHLGEKLFKIAKETRPEGSRPVNFKRFHSSHGHAHKFIYKSELVPKLVKNFIHSATNDMWPCEGFEY